MTKRLLAGLAMAALLVAPAAAEDPTKRGFDPDPARLALSLDGGFAVETAAAMPRGSFGMAAVLDLASGLLALKLGGERDQVLEKRLSLHLLAGWSLGRVEVAAHLPTALYQASDFSFLERQGVAGPLVAPVSRTALGDLRLGAKLPVLDAGRWPVGLAAMVDLRLPTGNKDAFMSDGLAVVPSVIATRALRSAATRRAARLHVPRHRAVRAARRARRAHLRRSARAVDLPPAGPLRRWRALAELTGGWPRGYDLKGERYRAPLSTRGGLRWFAWRGLSVEAGGGAGLGEAGYGHEAWRVFAGVRWGYGPGGVPHPPPLPLRRATTGTTTEPQTRRTAARAPRGRRSSTGVRTGTATASRTSTTSAPTSPGPSRTTAARSPRTSPSSRSRRSGSRSRTRSTSTRPRTPSVPSRSGSWTRSRGS